MIKEITAVCPECGCNGSLYIHSKTGQFNVSCEADDANNHDLEHVNDWCPGQCGTVWYDTESEAVNAWNTGYIEVTR